MFTAYWEVADEDREDCLDYGKKEFSNFADAIDWLSDKDDYINYYYIITDETGRVVHTGWMP